MDTKASKIMIVLARSNSHTVLPEILAEIKMVWLDPYENKFGNLVKDHYTNT